MLPSKHWLNALRASSGARSDYHLAQKLGVTPQAVSRWATGHNGFGPELADKVADFINIPAPLAVMAANYWKAKTTTERDAFQAAYVLLGGTQADEKIEELATHREAA